MNLGTDGFTGEYNSTKYFFKKSILILFKLFPKKRGRNISKFILYVQHSLDITIIQEHYKKRKLKANISDKHRCKNPQPHCI